MFLEKRGGVGWSIFIIEKFQNIIFESFDGHFVCCIAIFFNVKNCHVPKFF